ncbi:hypothetical protein DSUL_40131 [Desulfovibrionales bacterium]
MPSMSQEVHISLCTEQVNRQCQLSKDQQRHPKHKLGQKINSRLIYC